MSAAGKIFDKAKNVVGDKEQVVKVLSQSTAKIKELAENSSEWKELRSKVHILKRMVEVQLSGEYSAFSVSSILLIVFGLIYFITPTDAIPDFIPAVGFTDDASVLYLIVRKLDKDIKKYLSWKGAE